MVSILSKKQILAIMALAALLLLVPSTVWAQQETRQVAPETRNPQTSAPRLFQQNQVPQQTSPQNILTGQSKIKIPEGKPATENNEGRQSNAGRRLFLAFVSLLGVIASIKLFKKSQEIPDKKPAKLSAEKPEQPEPGILPTIPKNLTQSPRSAKTPGPGLFTSFSTKTVPFRYAFDQKTAKNSLSAGVFPVNGGIGSGSKKPKKSKQKNKGKPRPKKK